MAGFHGINIEHARRSLLKKLQPAMKAGLEAVGKECDKYLKEKLSVQYDGTSSFSAIKKRKGKWGKSWGKSKQVANTEYPRRRTGSLQASVGHKQSVRHGNIYQLAFGIVKNVFKGSASTKAKKNRTMFSEYKARQRRGAFPIPYTGTKMPTKPTLYAKYLEEGTKKMAPRKLVKQAFYELKQSGKLQQIWDRSKKRTGVSFRMSPNY